MAHELRDPFGRILTLAAGQPALTGPLSADRTDRPV